MLRSTYCLLNGLTDRDLTELNECPLDPGGYFIINGSEKVLIAQEKMATNTGIHSSWSFWPFTPVITPGKNLEPETIPFVLFSVRIRAERFQVRLQDRNSVLFGTLFPSNQHNVGEHDGSWRTGIKFYLSICVPFNALVSGELCDKICLCYSGCKKECHWTEDDHNFAVHQTGNPCHHHFPSFRLCIWQRHFGAHHLRLRRSRDDGNGTSIWNCAEHSRLFMQNGRSKQAEFYIQTSKIHSLCTDRWNHLWTRLLWCRNRTSLSASSVPVERGRELPKRSESNTPGKSCRKKCCLTWECQTSVKPRRLTSLGNTFHFCFSQFMGKIHSEKCNEEKHSFIHWILDLFQVHGAQVAVGCSWTARGWRSWSLRQQTSGFGGTASGVSLQRVSEASDSQCVDFFCSWGHLFDSGLCSVSSTHFRMSCHIESRFFHHFSVLWLQIVQKPNEGSQDVLTKVHRQRKRFQFGIGHQNQDHHRRLEVFSGHWKLGRPEKSFAGQARCFTGL